MVIHCLCSEPGNRNGLDGGSSACHLMQCDIYCWPFNDISNTFFYAFTCTKWVVVWAQSVRRTIIATQIRGVVNRRRVTRGRVCYFLSNWNCGLSINLTNIVITWWSTLPQSGILVSINIWPHHHAKSNVIHFPLRPGRTFILWTIELVPLPYIICHSFPMHIQISPFITVHITSVRKKQ